VRGVLLVVLLLAPSAARADPPLATELVRAGRLLDAWDVEGAQAIVDRAARAAPDDADALFLRARVRFHRGRYDEALVDVRQAIEQRRTREDWKAFRDLVESTQQVTRGFREVTTADGRFLLRFGAADAALVPWMEETLSTAARAIGDDLGLSPSGPIVVEVLPDEEALARVSTLSPAEIRASGTIALCKWNRLMVTSPRALVRGYPWRDTLCHELTHLVLSRVTAGRAPIWLHEGVAKTLEARWNSDAPAPIEPALAALLEDAAHSGALIPFERMHPSLAKLPTQEQASLAFAEVQSLLRHVLRRAGLPGLRAALGRVREGEPAESAIGRAVGTSWYRLVEQWRTELRGRRTAPEAARVLVRRFREGGDDDGDDAGEIREQRAQRLVRVGDLLWERQRRAAATIEYEAAVRVTPGEPIVANRAARALLETGRAADVEARLAPTLALYADFPLTWVHLGRARAATGDAAGAAAAFTRAVGLNPFDPEVACSLERLHRDRGRQQDAERAATACRALR
jgi:tetratricopeptide (TPR) repeat protein